MDEKATPSRVKVASIQFASRLGETAFNTQGLTELCREAAKNGAKIIVLPETSITGYLSQDLKTNWQLPGWPMSKSFEHGKDPTEFAETIPGKSSDHFAALAQEIGCYITIPLLEVDHSNKDSPKYYNSVCLAAPSGKIVTSYRKNTPWPHPEQSWATKGTELGTYQTEYGKVGLAICFDIHSILAHYAKEGIWTLLYPIAWVGNVQVWFRDLLPERLARCDVPFNIVGCNWSVEDESKHKWEGFGFTTIYGPNGAVLAGSGLYQGNDIVYASLPCQVGEGSTKMNYDNYKHKWDS